MLWGEISSFMTARQNHQHEIALLELQSKLDGERQARELEAIKLQHELGVQVVRVQGEAAVAKAEAEAWEKVAANVTTPSGIWLVDLWNGLVRPVLRARHALAGVDQEPAAEHRRPAAVLDVLAGVEDEPGPRLADAEGDQAAVSCSLARRSSTSAWQGEPRRHQHARFLPASSARMRCA